MKTRVLVLGAGFGGMELATTLSERLGDDVEVTLIEKAEGFVFGFAKLDVLFGRKSVEQVRLPYSEFVKPGVRLLRETVTAIDPGTRSVTTDAGSHEADYLVIALGADYDLDATPGLAEANEKINLWWPAALDMFGRSDSDFSDEYVKWGLRKLNNAELRRKYIAETRPLLEDLEIVVPPDEANRRFL